MNEITNLFKQQVQAPAFDQEAMSSGLAIEMRIWSKAGACTCCLKRLVISFIGSLFLEGTRVALCVPSIASVVFPSPHTDGERAHLTRLRPVEAAAAPPPAPWPPPRPLSLPPS